MQFPSSLRKHLIGKLPQLDAAELDLAIAEFHKFMILSLNSPRFFFPCSMLIDQIWHESIVETREYAALCDSICPGSFLHHTGMAHSEWMQSRSINDQDSEDLSVLASYYSNFGPFDSATVHHWVVATDIMKLKQWNLNQLNSFLKQISQFPCKTRKNIHSDLQPKIEDLIQHFHQLHPGECETFFSNLPTTVPGMSSYDILANCIDIITTENPVILEVGCGIGSMARKISNRFNSMKYFGIDQSESEIELARRRLFGPETDFTVADAKNLPFKDEFFDLIISHMSIHLIKDHEGLFSELKRVIKPNGHLYFTIPGQPGDEPGDKAYSSILSLFNELNESLKQTSSIYRNETDLLKYLQSNFGSFAVRKSSYQINLELSGNPLRHFELLYPYLTLNDTQKNHFKLHSEKILFDFKLNHPGKPITRTMVVYQAIRD